MVMNNNDAFVILNLKLYENIYIIIIRIYSNIFLYIIQAC